MTDGLHILLVRHGETAANARGVVQGHLPTPLSERGHEQARCVARRLAQWQPKVDVLVSSDLRRAVQTAEPIGQACGLPVILDPAWRECGSGLFEGQSHAAFNAWYYATGQAHSPGGEYDVDFDARITGSLRGLPGRFPEARTVAVVSHGGPMCTLLAMLSDGRLPLLDQHAPVPVVMIQNCAVLHLVSHRLGGEMRWEVRAINDRPHLA